MKTKAPRVLFIFLVLIFFATNAYSNTFKCTRVVDGDTIVVDYHGKLEKVRLIGVDTPETVHPNKPVEYLGKEASNFTHALVEGKAVTLEFDWQQRDKYGRLLAYVYLQDGILINKKIIEEGYGHAYTKYPFKYLDEFRAAERRAQDAGKGLWGASSNLTREEVKRVNGNKVLAAADAGGQIVYVTRTGAKYHRGHCRYLRRSKIPMKLRDAVAAGYTPCKVCVPPRL
jgi:micrococcal nuclease